MTAGRQTGEKNMITVNHITKTYQLKNRELLILKDINLEIPNQSFTGIIGDSGSGKSTLLSIMAGLEKPTDGEVLVNGKNLFQMKDREISRFRNQSIGFVFQSFHLLDNLTALENVMLPMQYGNVPPKQRVESAREALGQVGLSDRINHRPQELSGGQKQRVSIARAIVNDSRLIIADEPTGNLDSKSGETVMNLFQNLHRQGYTIIMVTHNMEHQRLFTQAIRMRDGEIVG